MSDTSDYWRAKAGHRSADPSIGELSAINDLREKREAADAARRAEAATGPAIYVPPVSSSDGYRSSGPSSPATLSSMATGFAFAGGMLPLLWALLVQEWSIEQAVLYTLFGAVAGAAVGGVLFLALVAFAWTVKLAFWGALLVLGLHLLGLVNGLSVLSAVLGTIQSAYRTYVGPYL